MSSVTVLAPAQSPSLSRVARHLLDLIGQQGLRPGDAVPSELQIGKDLGVSRGIVREAYRALAALGILGIENGRKPRLLPMNSRVLTQVFDYALNTAQVDVAHVLETRRAIELQTARLAARFASHDQRLRLRDLAAQMRDSGDDRALCAAADVAIHALIAEASDNPLNSLLLAAIRDPAQPVSRLHFDDIRSRSEFNRVISVHEAIVDRVCAGDDDGAASAMSHHFDLALIRAAEAASHRPLPAARAATHG